MRLRLVGDETAALQTWDGEFALIQRVFGGKFWPVSIWNGAVKFHETHASLQ